MFSRVVILVLSLTLLTGCGDSKPAPEVPAYLETLTANYDKLYADYVATQVELELLEVQYKELRDRNDKLSAQLANLDFAYKKDYETLVIEYKALKARWDETWYALLIVNSGKDPVINEYYPSDNETEEARWETFYEFWDKWWEEFQDNL